MSIDKLIPIATTIITGIVTVIATRIEMKPKEHSARGEMINKTTQGALDTYRESIDKHVEENDRLRERLKEVEDDYSNKREELEDIIDLLKEENERFRKRALEVEKELMLLEVINTSLIRDIENMERSRDK